MTNDDNMTLEERLGLHLRTWSSKYTQANISGADLNMLAVLSVKFLEREGLLVVPKLDQDLTALELSP